MADSGTLRTQRWKRHKAGDHSLCRRCVVLRAVDQPEREPVEVLVPGSPVERLNALARRLEAAHVADPANAFVGRELRLTLEALAKVEPAPVDLMGELRGLAGTTA